MAKSKKDEIETLEPIEAKKDESLVAVEMSPEQRDEFVDFMKDKKAKEAKEAEAKIEEQKVHVRLSVSHYINGKKYGPGVTEIPHSLLGQLQHQENNWKKHELSIFAPSRTQLMKVLEGGQVVNVGVNNAPKSVQEVFT